MDTMARIVKTASTVLLSDKCFDEYFTNFNFMDVECFKVTLSKGLGLGILLGSILVKVPQILKLKSARSAKGININAVLFDLFAITLHMSYSSVQGFPFPAWGDSVSLAIQTAIIVSLILYYNGKEAAAYIFAVVYAAFSYALMNGYLVSVDTLWKLQGFNVPLLLTGKLSQAYTNYKNGSTGQLSAITCTMLFFGSLARIFTSHQETGDALLIITYVASTFANAVILAQLVYYWNSDKADTKKAHAKKKRN